MSFRKKPAIFILTALILLVLVLVVRTYLPFTSSPENAGAAETALPDSLPAKPVSRGAEEKPFDPNDELMEVNYRNIKFWVDRVNPRLTEDQAWKIEEIMMKDRPPKQFKKNTEINEYYMGLKAPGQNGSTGGFSRTSIGVFTSFCVQIPHKPLYRFLVYRADTVDGPWYRYADFMYETPAFPRIGFEVRGDEVVFFDKHRSNKVMHTRYISRNQR